MSKSFKEEHPLGKVTEGDYDETCALCRDAKATDNLFAKAGLIFVMQRHMLTPRVSFLDGIVTDDFVYFV
jgi:hypothetical protein